MIEPQSGAWESASTGRMGGTRHVSAQSHERNLTRGLTEHQASTAELGRPEMQSERHLRHQELCSTAHGSAQERRKRNRRTEFITCPSVTQPAADD